LETREKTGGHRKTSTEAEKKRPANVCTKARGDEGIKKART